MSKIDDLKICVDILQPELVKVEKKFTDINEQIEYGYDLSDKQFDKLYKKRAKISERLNAIEYGLLYLRSEIEHLQYRGRMRGTND